MHDPLQRLYQTKLMLLATIFTFVGVGLLILARWVDASTWPSWVDNLPLGEVGGALFTTGFVAIIFDYLDGKDSDTRSTARFRKVLDEQAPAMRDAVIEGFAFKPEDLRRVSSPEVLDQISRNSLAIQLGDKEFAEAIYDDLRAQVFKANERWHDMEIDLTLSEYSERGTRLAGAPLLALTARWEYTVVPTENVRRFTAVSDAAEYRELTTEGGTGVFWHFVPANGLDGGDREAFELVQFVVDGQERPVRRTARGDSQAYTASIGRKAFESGKPVRISYTYRTLLRRQGNLLHLRIGQPTKGLRIDLRYEDANFDRVSVLDFLASSRQTNIIKAPDAVPDKMISLEFGGWALPASGVAFVWTVSGAEHTRH